MAREVALTHGLSLDGARTTVIAQVYGQLRLSAAVRSLQDCLLVAAAACLLAILPVLPLKRGTENATPAPVEA